LLISYLLSLISPATPRHTQITRSHNRRNLRTLFPITHDKIGKIPYAGYMMTLNRVTQNPQVMGGKPCIRNMRVTVGMIVNQMAQGHSIDEVLADYPYLEREDILEALRYALWRVEEQEIALADA
jgi:uncharacterized protein (DUF433 family)